MSVSEEILEGRIVESEEILREMESVVKRLDRLCKKAAKRHWTEAELARLHNIVFAMERKVVWLKRKGWDDCAYEREDSPFFVAMRQRIDEFKRASLEAK